VLAVDPNDPTALNNLAAILSARRQYAAAESLDQRQIRNGSGGFITYDNLGVTQFNAAQLAEATATLALTRQHYPANPVLELITGRLMYRRGQLDSLDALYLRARQIQQRGVAATANQLSANLAMMQGRLHDWARRQADSRAVDAAGGVTAPPLDDSLYSIWADVWFRGQSARGVARLDSLLRRVPLRTLPVYDRPYAPIVRIYAVAGRPDKARAILAELASEVKDSVIIADLTPRLHIALGEIALAEHRPRDAIAEFRHSDTLSDGYPQECTPCLPMLLARAYDAAGVTDSSVLNYEHYLAIPFVGQISNPYLDASNVGSSYKRLGELYENRGDRAKAAEYYTKFVRLWKDADPELQPVVADVKRRLAKLGSEPSSTRPLSGSS
jgi:tetratricopeptide (TPR) repeat protein